MKRPKKGEKRRYCEHCNEYVSVRSYYRHKRYLDISKTTEDSFAVDDSESDEHSGAGKSFH